MQQILGAGTAQMRAAILHYHLAIDVPGLIGNQKTLQVGKFASLSARSPSLQGYTPHTYPFFWNTTLKN